MQALSDKSELRMKQEMRVALCKRMKRSFPGNFGKGDCDGSTVVCGWCGCTIDEQADIVITSIAFEPETGRK